MATKFSDLTQQELYRSAIEDFAVDVKSTDSKKSIEAALLENVATSPHLDGAGDIAAPSSFAARRWDMHLVTLVIFNFHV